MRKQETLELRRELNEVEEEVYLYAYRAVDKDGNVLSNDDICRKTGLSIDELYDVLDSIDKKTRIGIYGFSD